MYLIAIVIAVCFLQIWGANNPFHKDEWYFNFVDFVRTKVEHQSPLVDMLLVVGAPVVIAAYLGCYLEELSSWLFLPFATMTLLYGMGRGEFTEYVYFYITACNDDDWTGACQKANSLGVAVDAIPEGDWQSLHCHTMEQACYRGFERLFAILFWFGLFGPAGALCYRLSHLYDDNYAVKESRYWLWVIEWPAVRVLGLTFALTGNFVGCLHHWKAYLGCTKTETRLVLMQYVLGALSVDKSIKQACDVSIEELEALQSLYTRTLWFWLAAFALLVIF